MKKLFALLTAVILLTVPVGASAAVAGPEQEAVDLDGARIPGAAYQDDDDSNSSDSQNAFWGKKRFSAELPNPSKYQDMTDAERFAAMKDDLKAMLDQKVKDGELTQEQADKMLEGFSMTPQGGLCLWAGPRAPFDTEWPDPSKYEGMTDEERRDTVKADLKKMLDKMVADGKLTREQADEMLKGSVAGAASGMGLHVRMFEDGQHFESRLELDPSKYEGMSDRERLEAMKADLKAILDQKVADGELTRKKADKIMEKFAEGPPPIPGKPGPGRDMPGDAGLDAAEGVFSLPGGQVTVV